MTAKKKTKQTKQWISAALECMKKKRGGSKRMIYARETNDDIWFCFIIEPNSKYPSECNTNWISNGSALNRLRCIWWNKCVLFVVDIIYLNQIHTATILYSSIGQQKHEYLFHTWKHLCVCIHAMWQMETMWWQQFKCHFHQIRTSIKIQFLFVKQTKKKFTLIIGPHNTNKNPFHVLCEWREWDRERERGWRPIRADLLKSQQWQRQRQWQPSRWILVLLFVDLNE